MRAKRVVDIVLASVALLFASPLLIGAGVLVWLQDGGSPLYMAPRVGLGGKQFRMIKLRSMRVGADRSGVHSTASGDPRITPAGRFIRRWKLDEMTQLWNVLRGEMSLVGPRPQVSADVDRYTHVERRLLDAPPGITDFASIVFADEAEILRGHADPDLAYQQLVRPWKSQLGLFYVERRTLAIDLLLIALTVASIVARQWTLRRVAKVLRRLGAAPDLISVALRSAPLLPHCPPGADAPFQRF